MSDSEDVTENKVLGPEGEDTLGPEKGACLQLGVAEVGMWKHPRENKWKPGLHQYCGTVGGYLE